MNDDDFDDFDDEIPELDDKFVETPSTSKKNMKLQLRRRIEDLEELRRMRQLFADDDFDFDNKY